MANKLSIEVAVTKILEIRGKKVILDKDLAMLYGGRDKEFEQSNQ